MGGIYRRAKYSLLYHLAATAIITNIGCDAFLGVAQQVTVHINSSKENESVIGAEVYCAQADHSGGPDARNMTDAEWLYVHAYRKQYTDNIGMANIKVDVKWIAGGIGGDYDVKRDRISGNKYIFRVACDGKSEDLRIDIMPGERACGNLYTLTIIDVGPPVKLKESE